MVSLDWLLLRFKECAHQPRRYDPDNHQFDVLTGDHALNQDMRPKLQENGQLRPASVLIPLVDHGGHLTVLLTQRTDHLNHHPGQISFPGGRAEPEDVDHIATALRETHEETGIEPETVKVIGCLDDYLTRSGFAITPVVGLLHPPLYLEPDDNEVADVFEVPLNFLMDKHNHILDERPFEGYQRQFYAMRYQERYIWGATAGMLKAFHDFLRLPNQ